MSLLSVTIILVVLAYLFFQAKSDAKTGYVYWLPNNILLTLFLILWIITVFYYLSFNAALSLLLETSALMLVLYLSTRNLPFLGKVMQPADAKAFSIVYFSSGISMSFIVSPLILLSTMFFCHITFIIWHRVVKKSEIGGRKPYFPFILVGYVLTIFLYIILYLTKLGI